MNLSPYHPNQTQEIQNLFTAVFTASEGQSEGILIGTLAYELITQTEEKDLRGFVATEAEKIVACIFFSRLTFESDIRAFILSPVAVHTEYQGKGIGQQLIRYGIEQMKAEGVQLLMTYGNPNYYVKVGFHPVQEDVIPAPLRLAYPEGWLAQSLVSPSVQPIPGASSCVKALSKPEYW